MKLLSNLDGASKIVTDANNRFVTDVEKNKLAGIADGAEVNVNADWNASSGDAQILNKPTIEYGSSSGMVTVPTYVNNGNGTITIGNSTARFYTTANFGGTIVEKTLIGNTFTPTDNANSYLVANYNSGTPIYQIITDVELINESTIFPVYSFYREGNILYLLDWDELGLGLPNKLHQRLVKTERFVRETGLILSEATVRKIIISSGKMWYGAVRTELNACDSSVLGATLYYHSSSAYTSSTISQYNNTQYDNGVNLITLTNNYYTVNWIYRCLNVTQKVFVVLGNAEYNKLSEALNSQPRTDLPTVITSQSLLVGRIIVQKGVDTAAQIDSAFATKFGTSGVSVHNDLASIQGGIVGEYYHLSQVDASSVPNKLDKTTFEKLGRYGFTNNAETTISFDGVNTFTLARTGSTFSYFRAGVLCTISTNKTVVLTASPPATAGLYYIYIDNTTGDLTADGAWTFEDTRVFVATVAWNNALTPKFQLADERHTCLIDRQSHRREHLTEGTQLISTGLLTGYNLNSSTDTDKVFGIPETKIADEDLFQTLTALADPNGSTAVYTNFYRTASTTWVWASSTMPFKYTTTGFIEYDNAGTMTPITNGRFVNTYLFVSNISGVARFAFITGRGNFSNANAAYAENFSSFDLTGFPVNEGLALYQLTWAGINNAGTGQCQLNRVQRITNNIITTAINQIVDHNGLANLQGGGSGEYYHLTSAKYGYLNTATSDIQAQINGKKTDSMTTNKLLGRGSASNGVIEEITLGTGLSLVGTTLSTSAVGGDTLTIKTQEYTATASQTIFTLTLGSYVQNKNRIEVWVGIPQPPSSFTETSTTVVTLSSGVPVGTKVVLKWIEVVNLSDALTRVTSEVSSATSTPTIVNTDMWVISALAEDDAIQAPTGTPVNGQRLMIRITDNGTPRNLSWNAIYKPIGVILPLTTVANKTVYVGCIYNSTSAKFEVIAVAQEG